MNTEALLPALGTTFLITITAIFSGLVLGALIAVIRESNTIWSKLAKLYVDGLRSMPLAIVLLLFFMTIPNLINTLLKVNLDSRLMTAMIAFSMFESAYFSEIMRNGLKSISRNQYDAAKTLGMNKIQIYRLIILPQAFKKMIPVFITQSVVLFQDTSLVYMIGLADFFTTAKTVGENSGELTKYLLIAGVFYFSVSLLFSTLSTIISKKA